MLILVTGAAGKVGSAAAAHLIESGHDVVATDALYRPGLGFPLQVADLCDHHTAYRLVEGCDAVIHLANHAHIYKVRPPQKLLAENAAMNANVFRAAVEVGIRKIIDISTTQVMIGLHHTTDPSAQRGPCVLPYLPIDGQMPRNPGNNEYALSKALAEQHLEAMTQHHPDLAAIAVRLPLVLPDRGPLYKWATRPLEPNDPRLFEALCYVHLADVSTALRAMVEQIQPGYRQYFLSQSLGVRGVTPDELAARFFPDQAIKRPLSEVGGMVDLSELNNDFDWQPAEPPLIIDQAPA